MKVGRTSLYRFIAQHPEVRDWLDEYREDLVDVTEFTVRRAVMAGDLGAARFVLKTLARIFHEGIRNCLRAVPKASGRPRGAVAARFP